MLDIWRSWYYMIQHDFVRALAATPKNSMHKLASFLPQAYYRLGMYATVAALPLQPTNRRHLLPAIVSMAACGQYARVREVIDAAPWAQVSARRRVALADALAPFMPREALQLLTPVRRKASPTLYAGLLLRTGRVQRARQVLDDALTAGKATRYPELHLYRSMADPGAPQQQLTRLNHFFAAYNLPPVCLQRLDEPPNPCNVWVPEMPAAADGPLVSVLMTTFNTGERASAAIQSLLNQTYRNLEIVVVDDASQDDTPDLIATWARKDARVRLLRLPKNGGTFLAKNVGLMAARGDFVTCHDSDDWSHPLKIELQVRPLLQDAALVATTSCWIRMTDTGMYYARPVHPLMRLNPSSPMFRRERVLQRMGPWDCVRTGADSEFLARLRLVFGRRAIKRIAKPLALGAHRDGSLMTANATGYAENGTSPQRLAYWEAWAGWHLACLRRGELPCLPQDLVAWTQHRPFEVPADIAVSAEQVITQTRQPQYQGDRTT